MARQVRAALTALAALAVLVCGGMPRAQAKDYPGPYDHAGRGYYADEARYIQQAGFDFPMFEWSRYRQPSSYSYSPSYYSSPSYYGGYPYAIAPDYSYGAYAPAADNLARVRVMVPADAKVWFDGKATRQDGTDRRFESPALTPGRIFSYEVKAQWRDKDGKEVTRSRRVDVSANANVTVDFTRE
jgi:uncharacterized protein (TIGR03000 family)